MTKDEILALSGDDLDALVAEKVMGIDKEHLFHAPLLNYPVGFVHRRDLEGDSELAKWYRNEPRGEWKYCGRAYSKDPNAFLQVLDRMIELGYKPELEYYDRSNGWIVDMGNSEYVSKDLKEAVCKCALIAVMGCRDGLQLRQDLRYRPLADEVVEEGEGVSEIYGTMRWYVECDRCGNFLDEEQDEEEIVPNFKEKWAKYLVELGWMYDKEEGWLCPECAEKVKA